MPTFTPTPGNPHPNAISLPLAGEYLSWGQIQATNYTVGMYGGDGTIEMDSPSKLVNSTFDLQGAGANLLNNGEMTLQQSQLEVDGGLVGSGSVNAMQGSTITVQSSSAVADTWADPASLSKQQLALLSGAPPELINLQSSTLNVLGGATNFGSSVIMDAGSTINLQGSFSASNWSVYSAIIYSPGPQLGTLNVNGPTTESGGVMNINANIVQNHATIDVANASRLQVSGSVSGGTIDITSGTLEFAQLPSVIHAGPGGPPPGVETSSENFTSTLEFDGQSGAVQFDGYSSITLGIKPDMSEITVSSDGQQIADLHLTPPPDGHPYSAADFSVSNNTLIYNQSTPAQSTPAQSTSGTPTSAQSTLAKQPDPPPALGTTVLDTTTGQPLSGTPQAYAGPVAGLTSEYINVTSDSLNVTATTPNWFIHSGSGNDAISANSGTNVLDGGTGSNFLTGGSGADTFFIDDRGPASDIWSTVNNFHSGDAATIWGVTPSDFALSWVDGQGAAGYTGLTLHSTAAGVPTASLTMPGFSSADLSNGKLTASFGTTAASGNVPGSNYMYIHAN
jgi:hypothetical protein